VSDARKKGMDDKLFDPVLAILQVVVEETRQLEEPLAAS
jgi:hypothetical protein